MILRLACGDLTTACCSNESLWDDHVDILRWFGGNWIISAPAGGGR